MFSEHLMHSFKEFLRRWWPTALTFAVIAYATLSSDPLPEYKAFLIPHLDKLIHAVMFGGLVGAVCFDRARAGYSIGPAAMLWTGVAVCLLGAVDEVAQAQFTDSRAADILDWCADTAGVLVACFTAPPAVRAVLRRSS